MNWTNDTVLPLLPIGISLLALCISVLALGWNIYRDVVLKPRLKTRFSLSTIHHSTLPQPFETLVLSATNFGPGAIKCSMIYLKVAPLWRRLLRLTRLAVLFHDYENPLSGKLPTSLEVGEGVSLLISWREDCFLGEGYTHIGLCDSFGRVHWAPPKHVRKAREAYQKRFGKKGKGVPMT